MITPGIDGEFEISALPCLEVHRKDGGLGQLAQDGLENLSEFIDAEGAQAMPGAPDPVQAGMTEDEHLQAPPCPAGDASGSRWFERGREKLLA